MYSTCLLLYFIITIIFVIIFVVIIIIIFIVICYFAVVLQRDEYDLLSDYLQKKHVNVRDRKGVCKHLFIFFIYICFFCFFIYICFGDDYLNDALAKGEPNSAQ
jgi:magnesium-transporting ATPase (P-type)